MKQQLSIEAGYLPQLSSKLFVAYFFYSKEE